MLRTSMRERNVCQPNFSSRAFGIINLKKKHFLNFVTDTMNGFPDLLLGERRFLRKGLSELE